MRRILFSTAMLAAVTSFGQTNPVAQTLPYSQNFGTSTFATMPAGSACWNGLDGSTIASRASAEASVASGNASLGSRASGTNTGGSYSFTTSANARLYIQTSAGATEGANQLVVAVNTGSSTALQVSYEIELLNDQNNRSMGSVLQYRQGTAGSWNSVGPSAFVYGEGSTNDGDADDNGDVDNYSFIVTGLVPNTVYQFRWAHWRTTGTANSVGIAYDNILIESAIVGAPLPVKFGNIKASQTAAGVNLQWMNLTETDVATYTLERSSNGREFSSIAQIGAAKNDGGKTSYQHLDPSPINGLSYYRIKAVEKNGKTVYSDMVRMSINGLTSSLVVYPNPVKGNTIGWQVSNLQAGNYTVRIYTNSSQVLSSQSVKHSGGSFAETVSLNNLKPGVYTLEISGEVKLQKQFIVQ